MSEDPAPVVKQYTLDFSNVTTFDECYDVINDKLGFGDFGRNLDALVDLLRGGFGHFARSEWASLVINGREHVARVAEETGQLRKWQIMEEIFTDSVKGKCGERVKSCEWTVAPAPAATTTTEIVAEIAPAHSAGADGVVATTTDAAPALPSAAAASDTADARLYGADPATAHGSSMGPSELIPAKLYLGPAPAMSADTCAVLKRVGITHIVNVTPAPPAANSCPFPTKEQVPGAGGHGVARHRVAVQDMPKFAAAIQSKLAASTAFIRSAIAGGGRVYVHCAMGVSRSTTVVLAYRMSCLGEPLRTAFDRTRARRACAAPNPGFWKVLCELEATLGRPASYPVREYVLPLVRQEINSVFGCDKFSEDEVREALKAHDGDTVAAKQSLFVKGWS